MPTSASPAAGRRPSPRHPATRLDYLMREIVDRLSPGQPVQASSDLNSGAEQIGEQIIIDTEIDGVRYRLVRIPKAPHSSVVLSPREQEIVRMVAQGYPNKVIARLLNISSWTVCTHLRHIFAKLGVGSRAAMVARYGAIDSLAVLPSRRID